MKISEYYKEIYFSKNDCFQIKKLKEIGSLKKALIGRI